MEIKNSLPTDSALCKNKLLLFDLFEPIVPKMCFRLQIKLNSSITTNVKSGQKIWSQVLIIASISKGFIQH